MIAYRPLLLATALCLPMGSVLAQTVKPTLRLIVGYPAGGSADAIARMVAERIKDELQSTVIVENKPGAGGQIAADLVRSSPADGTTFLVANSHMMVMLPLTSKTVKYNPESDFSPIGRMTSFYEAIAVPSSTPVTQINQWTDLARKDAKYRSYGVPAAGSVSQFIGYKLGADAKVTMQAIPYKGAAPLVQDLLGEQVLAGILPILDVVPHQQSGKLRVLAVNGSRRAQLLPSTPTLKELGVDGFDSLEWTALLAPPSTPKPVVDRMNGALNKVLASADIQQRLLKLGMEANPSTPDELSTLIRGDLATWGPVVKASGFTAD